MQDGCLLWKNQKITEYITYTSASGRSYLTYPDLPDSLYHALFRSASRFPQKTAFVDNYGTICTYEDFLKRVDELAAYLTFEKGIQKGTHIGVMMYNCTEYCVAYLAASRIGAVLVSLPSKFKQKEVLPLAQMADVEFLICDEDFANWFCPLYSRQQILIVKDIASGNGFLDAYSFWNSRTKDLEALTSLPYAGPSDEALILFTSGTTSQSKGVLLKNFNIMHAVETYRRLLCVTDQDCSVVSTPIYHITGLVALVGLFLFVGGTLYLHKFFDANRVIQDAKKHHFTFFHASPSVFLLLLKAGRQADEIPSLRTLACGSGNMPRETLFQIHCWLPHSRFHTVYGLTETSSPATIFPGDAATSSFIGSSGFPIPGTKFKILNEQGEELPNGEIGEIMISGTVVLESYYHVENASLDNGWLATGDLGYFNREGYLFVADRKKDMINRGGEKIWCFDIENELLTLDGIEEAAVVGIPNPLYGETAAALLVTTPGVHWTQEQIHNTLHGRIASYKIPSRILFTDQIPLTANGKTDKQRIRLLFQQKEGEKV